MLVIPSHGPRSGPFYFPFHCWSTLRACRIININVINVLVYGPWAGVLTVPVSLLAEVSYVTDSQQSVINERKRPIYRG